jgi:hypothetical protein
MARVLRVMYDFKAEDEGELSVSAGQMVLLSGTYGVYLLGVGSS